jgi:hypothetical protein
MLSSPPPKYIVIITTKINYHHHHQNILSSSPQKYIIIVTTNNTIIIKSFTFLHAARIEGLCCTPSYCTYNSREIKSLLFLQWVIICPTFNLLSLQKNTLRWLIMAYRSHFLYFGVISLLGVWWTPWSIVKTLVMSGVDIMSSVWINVLQDINVLCSVVLSADTDTGINSDVLLGRRPENWTS